MHPLGLALAIDIDPARDPEKTLSIISVQEDLCGMIFDESIAGTEEFADKAYVIQGMICECHSAREVRLGYIVQPVKGKLTEATP